jgi:hypothetical protein
LTATAISRMQQSLSPSLELSSSPSSPFSTTSPIAGTASRRESSSLPFVISSLLQQFQLKLKVAVRHPVVSGAGLLVRSSRKRSFDPIFECDPLALWTRHEERPKNKPLLPSKKNKSPTCAKKIHPSHRLFKRT